TPAVSVNNGKGLSMGVALNIMYAEGRLTKYQDIRLGLVQQGLSPQAAGQAASQDEAAFGAPYADIEGDVVAVDFRVGFLDEFSEETQIGVTGQTVIVFNLKGDIELSGYPVATVRHTLDIRQYTL